MTEEANLLITLTAIRSLGEHYVDEKAPMLKALKTFLASAIEKGYVVQEKVLLSTINKAGKAGKAKETAVIKLSETGKALLDGSAHPNPLANLQVISQMRSQLEQDRQRLLAEVQSSLKGQEDVAKIQKEIQLVAKKVEALSEQLTKFQTSVRGVGSNDAVASIDKKFAEFLTKLDHLIAKNPIPTASTQHPSPSTHSLKDVLHKAYEKLCLFIEFNDGMVELPRLYHEVRKTLPNLTVEDFHKELRSLWEAREVQIHILNEVYKAAEPNLGFYFNDKLYYYLLWKHS